MDYKYIEQLLGRYWTCETTLEEEAILHAFFAQQHLPAHLAKYRDFFVALSETAQPTLGENFDERMCKMVEESQPVKVRARRISLSRRLMPLYRAVAVVAVVALTAPALWTAINNPKQEEGWDYNAAAYSDTNGNPQEAYDFLSDGMQTIKDLITVGGAEDSLNDATKILEP